MNYQTIKEHSKWLSQVSAATSLIVIVFMQSKFIFVSGNFAGNLLLISLIAAVFTFIFGLIALPRWQGFLALAIFSYVAYCILFTPLYAIS
jgi:hypothetical protein